METISRGEMFQRANSRMSAYKSDMDIDYRIMIRFPKTKYLLFVRDWGTHLIMFHKIRHLPEKGAKVPYLFDKADRQRIVRGWGEMMDYFLSNNPSLHYDIYYFDGEVIHPDVEIHEAENIVRHHTAARFYEFEKEA